MPKVSTTTGTTATVTTEVEIKPHLRKRLVTQLAEYASLDEQIKILKKEQDAIKVTIEGVREEIGAPKLEIEGAGKITRVTGTTSKLDKKKFVSLGGKLAILERATITKPKKPYTLITLPGQDKEEGDE